MGSLFPGEKYAQLYVTPPRTFANISLALLLGGIVLVPTIGQPHHLAGFLGGLFYASWFGFLNYAPRLVDRHIVDRLYRVGGTLHVELRSVPGFPRGFSCPLRDAYAWQLTRSWRGSRLVFHFQGKRYVASMRRGSFIDASAMLDAYPELGPLAL